MRCLLAWPVPERVVVAGLNRHLSHGASHLRKVFSLHAIHCLPSVEHTRVSLSPEPLFALEFQDRLQNSETLLKLVTFLFFPVLLSCSHLQFQRPTREVYSQTAPLPNQ